MGNKIAFFGKPQFRQWDRKLMHQHIEFVDGLALQQEMKDYTDIADDAKLKIDFRYPIYKKIGGVRIETGWLQLKKSNLTESLTLLSDFLSPLALNDPQQNLQALSSWAELFDWETPSSTQCAGYILNRELVRFEETSKGSCLFFKFKDEAVDIFLLYRIWFLITSDNYFFLIQKTY